MDPYVPSSIVLRVVLEQRGYVCAAAASASEGIVAMEAFSPDVVVYEWNMPEGKGLARRLRSNSPHPVSIVAASTQAEPENFSAEEGVDSYLTKPFNAERLHTILTEVLRAACRP